MSKPHSLQGRLAGMVLGMVAALWAATAALTWVHVRHELGELLDSHLAQAAALLVVQQGAEIEDDAPGVDAPTLHPYAPRVAFQVFHEGKLTLRSANAPAQPMLGPDRRAQDGYSTVSHLGTTWRVFATRGREQDVWVLVGEQVESRDEILWAVLRSTLSPMLLALPLLGLAVWWALRRGLMPLRLLGRTLAQRDPQDLKPVAPSGAPLEMEPMLRALNGLFERIGSLIEAERRFTADAAHELRTPIAAVRAQAQVALGAASDAERQRALQATLQGCDRAAHLVDQLLTMSRLESGTGTALSLVDVAAVMRRVAADTAPAALARQQSMAVQADQPCIVRGDETLLAVLGRNLIDNAIRYSPPGAAVDVHVSSDRGEVRILIEDGGSGMSQADIERLGERFFRVMGSGADGSGLGWSIVRRIAGVHQARINVMRSAALGGLRVEISLPQAVPG